MAVLVNHPPPCVLFEDDHLLAVHKPPGMNTHAPTPYAGEGLHEWLKHREPRWASLAIIHRLDKATSGVMIFAKTKEANRSLTEQFATRKVRKTYLFLTTQPPAQPRFTVKTSLIRTGEKYLARPLAPGAPLAETEFESLGKKFGYHLMAAHPLTGRTHQIRVHAAARQLAILGDELYGGRPFPRVCLHSRELTFQHPVTGKAITLQAEPDFFGSPALLLRTQLIHPEETNAFRVTHGAADGTPGLYVERWGQALLAQSEAAPDEARLQKMANATGCTSVYFKTLNRQVRRATPEEAAPQLVLGDPLPGAFPIQENGVRFEISFEQGYSVGLFLDQRDNRRRLLHNHVAAAFELFPDGMAGREILNTFAYTCGFSVCAALAGARTTSLNLSKKYLDWVRRNFALNEINLAGHDFIFGDVFDWARRFEKKGRTFDLIILDPPTFSQPKGGAPFQAEKHYGKLVAAILPLVRKGGVILASTNAQKLTPEQFLAQIEAVVRHHHRRIAQQHYVPQPPDFPVHREEPAYLKTAWLRID